MIEKKEDQEVLQLQSDVQRFLAWGPVSSWHSKMFDELSVKVLESTNVLLSVSTLKRFFGVVNYSGKPSITTLDTLSKFIGKENYRAYKQGIRPVKKLKIPKPTKSIYLFLGFLIAIITISFIGNKQPELLIDSSDFIFTSKVLSKEYPNSVIFDVQIPSGIEVDSVKIQQYWDARRTIELRNSQTKATGIYYFPGYFLAKLIVNDQIAKQHDLFLQSEGWLGLVEYEPIPKYFTPNENDGSSLQAPLEVLREVSAQDSPIRTSFHYVKDFGRVSGNDFTLSTKVKSVFDDRWAVCQALDIYILGTDGVMIIPFSKLGCSSEKNLMLSEKYLRGKENDLSTLSANFSSPVEIKIEVLDKNVRVSIDSNEVYTIEYKETMGNLVGLRYKFLGVGDILNYRLEDQNGDEIKLESRRSPGND